MIIERDNNLVPWLKVIAELKKQDRKSRRTKGIEDEVYQAANRRLSIYQDIEDRLAMILNALAYSEAKLSLEQASAVYTVEGKYFDHCVKEIERCLGVKLEASPDPEQGFAGIWQYDRMQFGIPVVVIAQASS